MLSHSGRHPLSRPHPQLYRHPAQAPFTRAQISPIGPRRSSLPAAGIKNGLSNYVGRVTSTVFPDGTISHAAYDPLGHVVSQTDQNGNTRTFSYDAESH